jgi:hypothetical protein
MTARGVARFLSISLPLTLAASGAWAQSAPPVPTPTPEHPEVNIIVYGDDPCPKGKGDEIVVCSRQPESERYRIPKRFRGKKLENSPAGNSWANKMATTEEVSRTAGGVPNSCSSVGAAGQTGCQQQFLTQSYRQRQQAKEQQQDQQDGTSGTP